MHIAPLSARTLFLLLLLLPMAGLRAQQRTAPPEKVVMHVEGLTSATRDALVRDLGSAHDVELVYACVPAGLLVFASRTSQNRSDLETRCRAALLARSVTATARTLDQSQADAEAACTQFRNR